MGDLWTPPRGFFPGALSWFHAGNIDRFQPKLVADSECDWILSTNKIMNVGTACVSGVIGKPVHIWYGQPPTKDGWGTIASCDGNDYICTGITFADQGDVAMTIGTGVAATLQDFFQAIIHPGTSPGDTAAAIRYGWFFSDQNLAWWRYIGFAIHWLGPPP